jgi:tRNA-specific 2-thiouridylase
VLEDGVEVGAVDAVELVTIGQRRGLGLRGGTAPRYVTGVDVATRTVTVGPLDALLTDAVRIERATWVDREPNGRVLVQSSAHGRVTPAAYRDGTVTFAELVRRIAPGQSVVLYDGDRVLGGGVAASTPARRP